jgi:hypothetical protein
MKNLVPFNRPHNIGTLKTKIGHFGHFLKKFVTKLVAELMHFCGTINFMQFGKMSKLKERFLK